MWPLGKEKYSSRAVARRQFVSGGSPFAFLISSNGFVCNSETVGDADPAAAAMTIGALPSVTHLILILSENL